MTGQVHFAFGVLKLDGICGKLTCNIALVICCKWVSAVMNGLYLIFCCPILRVFDVFVVGFINAYTGTYRRVRA